jgi:hypothetical protein
VTSETISSDGPVHRVGDTVWLLSDAARVALVKVTSVWRDGISVVWHGRNLFIPTADDRRGLTVEHWIAGDINQ